MVKKLQDGSVNKSSDGLVEVFTAIPLDEADKLKLKQRFINIMGKETKIEYSVDTSLIGGMIIKSRDKLIDGSIRNKLNELKEAMGKGKI
jgi:F-type H+-transporting ATPase subunit delta